MKPNFLFFRSWPATIEEQPPLASSMQALETCFILLSCSRYPHALISCVTAIESAIRAKLGLPAEDKTKLWQLLEVIQNNPHNIKDFSRKSLNELCDARNRIAHYGFSPLDDDTSVVLLIRTGLPLLKRCYQRFFNFYLDWRDVRPGVANFYELSSEEIAKVGLIPEFADSLNLVRSIYSKAKELRGINLCYCITPFSQHIRFALKENYLGLAEQSLLSGTGGQEEFDAENTAKDRIEKVLKKTSSCECFYLDCPICAGCDSVVAQINDSHIDNGVLSFHQALCVKCGLFLPKKPFITDIVLQREIEKKREDILVSYGIK